MLSSAVNVRHLHIFVGVDNIFVLLYNRSVCDNVLIQQLSKNPPPPYITFHFTLRV